MSQEQRFFLQKKKHEICPTACVNMTVGGGCGRRWFNQDRAARVSGGGTVFSIGHDVYDADGCVRPALTLSNLESSDLQIGDKFEFGGIEFEIISDNLAFCVTDLGACTFREDCMVTDANDYEVSDVKRFVDNWFTNAARATNI